MTTLLLLAIALGFALYKRRPHGGDGPDRPADGGDRRPSQQHGDINAGESVSKAQEAVAGAARRGRPVSGEERPSRPYTPQVGIAADPVGGVVSYGKNSLSHLRAHAQHIRTAARADGVEIPSKGHPEENREQLRSYLERVVREPQQVGVGRYLSVEQAIWSRRGNLIVVRKMDGEWITALDIGDDITRPKGAAGGAPWYLPDRQDPDN